MQTQKTQRYSPDEQLVHDLKNGDEKAFSVLYDWYCGKLYRISVKMGLGHEDAECVVQDVFVTIWRMRSGLDESLSINAYMITILKSMVIKKIKRGQRFDAYSQHASMLHTNETNQTEEEVIFSDLQSISERMIESLPESQRKIFMMKNQENMTADEIAVALNLSKRTVENHVYRATKWLKEKLGF